MPQLMVPIIDLQTPEKDPDISSIETGEGGTELEMRRKIKYGRPIQACWGLFSEYCKNSTIHGVKYLGEHRRPWVERVWWIIVFAFSIYACFRLILNVWNKWEQNPVILSFAGTSTPVWQIPFPTVTICPQTKSKSELFNYTSTFHELNRLRKFNMSNNMTEEEIRNYNAISQVCDAQLHSGFNVGNTTSGSDIVDILRGLSPQLDPIWFNCKWRNGPDTCESLFSEIVTEEGICYTFNILNQNEMFREENLHKDYSYLSHNKTSDHWSLEKGYSKEASLSPYPVRVLSAEARADLMVLLPLYKYDLDYICQGSLQGFKIRLHTPSEMPRVQKQYLRVPVNQDVVVAVKPNMITTSKGLKDYSPNRRQCFFNHERYLRFFKVYTEQNCELECLANFTIKKCGCAKFSMPRDKDTPICGAMSIKCYTEAENELLRKEITEGLAYSKLNRECNCLPSCTSITYDAEISQTSFDWERVLMAYDSPVSELPDVKLVQLSIFFKETLFYAFERSELFGPTDFLANCGGLLGLFMGVSFLSIVEIVYYMTIRLISNLMMRRKRKVTTSMKQKSPIVIVKSVPDTKE